MNDPQCPFKPQVVVAILRDILGAPLNIQTNSLISLNSRLRINEQTFDGANGKTKIRLHLIDETNSSGFIEVVDLANVRSSLLTSYYFDISAIYVIHYEHLEPINPE